MNFYRKLKMSYEEKFESQFLAIYPEESEELPKLESSNEGKNENNINKNLDIEIIKGSLSPPNVDKSEKLSKGEASNLGKISQNYENQNQNNNDMVANDQKSLYDDIDKFDNNNLFPNSIQSTGSKSKDEEEQKSIKNESSEKTITFGKMKEESKSNKLFYKTETEILCGIDGKEKLFLNNQNHNNNLIPPKQNLIINQITDKILTEGKNNNNHFNIENQNDDKNNTIMKKISTFYFKYKKVVSCMIKNIIKFIEQIENSHKPKLYYLKGGFTSNQYREKFYEDLLFRKIGEVISDNPISNKNTFESYHTKSLKKTPNKPKSNVLHETKISKKYLKRQNLIRKPSIKTWRH